MRLRILCAVALLSAPAFAQAPADSVPLTFTLIDVPEFAQPAVHVPTWEQSVNLTQGVFEASHLGLHYGFDALDQGHRRWWTVALEVLLESAFDFANYLLPVPLTLGWMHEEGHRSAMAVKGLSSLQAYDNAFLAAGQRCDPGSVCGLTDEQIAKVKDARPADWVRVQEAGMEAELDLQRRVGRNGFFYDVAPYVQLSTRWTELFSVEFYRFACIDDASFTAKDITNESQNQLQRDFTGPDCTGWSYDLFRANQPYVDRGEHPHGGVLRVRLPSSLSQDERTYLVQMRNLGLLNFVDPQLFGFARFSVPLASGQLLHFNASVQHDLTAFGDELGLQALVMTGDLRGFVVAHAYRNQRLTLPGLSLGIVRYPLQVGPVKAWASASVDLWLQPSGLSFSTSEVMPGAALEVSASATLVGPLEVFAAVRAKSLGWKAGDPYLDPSVSFRMGLTVLMPTHAPH